MSRFEHVPEVSPRLDGKSLRVGIVLARFNVEVGENLLSGCVTELLTRGVAPEHMMVVTVPGALELPLTLQTMARSGRYDALVALGAVIRGDTYHFEVVSNEMAAGITRVTLDTSVPIANGVLTTEDDDQAAARMHIKGQECAVVAIEMANLLKVLQS
ncbi:MAG TPA: 6,7-dimethyl-8-ribityllumazine synthase [Rhodocyclaceae bacterium]|nr:6,7-dimethyl-8-ribityllumazine synthase [Rhodocyclaceae bacterium]